MTDSQAKLNDILDFEQMKKLFRFFSVTTGLDVYLFDNQGNRMLYHFCDVGICGLNKDACRKSIVYGGKKSAELGEPYIYGCNCGLILCSSPIMFENELIGSVVCGPVMLWERDSYAENELKSTIYEKNIDCCAYGSFDKIKSLECINMTSAANILFLIVNGLCREHSRYLNQRARISEQQARICELIAQKKTENANYDTYNFPADTEKELIISVRTGDYIQAKKVLNKFLEELFSFASGNNDTIKARIFELTAFLSRSCVEAGAPLNGVNKIVKQSFDFLNSSKDFAEICFLAGTILEEFISLINSFRPKTTSAHLEKVIDYIHKNYREELSLNKAAGHVYISGYYLSHLFREELNTTFSDYVCKVRIEVAKELLKNKDLKMQEVTTLIGFNDANYFTKVFKKLTGMTPKEFQSNL